MRVQFASRTARISFWTLLVGVLLIIVAGITLFGLYLNQYKHRISARRLTSRVVRAVMTAQTLPPEIVKKHPSLLNEYNVRVWVTDMPVKTAAILTDTQLKDLRHYIKKHLPHFVLSVQLANGKWVNLHASLGRINYWAMVGIVAAAIVLVIALVLLCAWAIKQVAFPLTDFAKAAQRFGVDVHAPPLAQTGSAEMQEVIKAFNEMQARIRRLLHDRTQMLAAISHDLRTPITRLQLRAEYLQGTDQYDKAVADLKEMENMISSILSFARDYVRDEPMERFDLNALLATLCDEMHDLGQPVDYVSDEQRVTLFGRIYALKRAFNNLIGNAVKYGNKAHVRLKELHHAIQVVVSDEGPGLPDDQLEKVFDPFYRVDMARSLQKGGTGLGLTVARDIIRAHGGDIELLNRQEQGLSAVVTLPLAGSQASE